MRIIRALASATLLIALITPLSSAQDFFEKDFVGSMTSEDEKPVVAGGNRSADGTQGSDSRSSANRKKAGDSESDPKDFGFVEFSDKANDKPVTTRKDRDDIIPDAVDKGDAIKTVKVIVSSEDAAHFERTVLRYVKLLTTRQVESSGITAVIKDQDPAEIITKMQGLLDASLRTEEEQKTLNISEAELEQMPAAELERIAMLHVQSPLLAKRIHSVMLSQVAYEIPKEYQIERLPTWVLETDQGTILLEGIEDPSSMITKNGKFIPPHGEDSPT